jgi:hypothetical protein
MMTKDEQEKILKNVKHTPWPPSPPSGWKIDADDWLWRLARPGDPGSAFWINLFNSHGFVSNGKVFTRYAETAIAYDRASQSGTL